MLDIITRPAQLRGIDHAVQSTNAQLFVNGEHTAADTMTRQIILQLLEEIHVLEDAKPYLTVDGETPKVGKRTAERVEKQIGFMASFLRTTSKVDQFGILMDRHRWTGVPCGYTAARTITKALLDNGYILKFVAPRKGQSTVYRCSETFRDRLLGWWGLLNFKRARPHPVEVREPKKDYLGALKKRRLTLGQFPSDEVRRHQDRVIQLNDQLSRYSLLDAMGRSLDTTLRRIFAGDFSNGGRLYADYQNMPEEDRLRCTIDGEPVCEIDLKASHVAVLAALYQHPERLPQDPYSAIRWVDTPLHRKAAKNLVQCIVHADGGRPTKFPRQSDGVPFKVKYELEGKKVTELLPCIFEVMPFLDGSPCLTLPLQFIEAEVLIAALERCWTRGLPAFSIHDSLLVKRSDEQDVLRLLQVTLREFLGAHAPWLDISIAGQAPRLVEPLPCPMSMEYLLQGVVGEVTRMPIEYGHKIDVTDQDDTGDF